MAPVFVAPVFVPAAEDQRRTRPACIRYGKVARDWDQHSLDAISESAWRRSNCHAFDGRRRGCSNSAEGTLAGIE